MSISNTDLFSNIEFLQSGIIYTINTGVTTDTIDTYLEKMWGDSMRWQFYGDSRVLVYKTWTAKEDESDSDSDDE